ncbi:MAG TPA: hypothetical protein VGI39_26535 [Polyangiaceae bacterium]|jgi:hypothetical protein
MTKESKIRALAGAATLALGAALAPSLGHAATARLEVGQVEEGSNYDLKPETVGDCKVGAECVVKLTATTKGDYHVNDTYPFKLTLAAAGVEFHGSAGATFAGADFERQGKTVGVMTIKFKPSAKGQVTLAGKYKVCFCTDQTCAPAVIDVSIPVTVK